MSFEAIIFDLDGTLIDSEAYWPLLEVSFWKKYNIDITEEYRRKMYGQSQLKNVEMVKRDFNLSDSLETLLNAKNLHTERIYETEAEPMVGANEIISLAKKQGKKIAIASGSSTERIIKVTSRLGWNSYFDVLASAENVNEVGKPDPAIFNYTVGQLKMNPESCVVIEDSYNGIVAAKNAGLTCALIPDPRWSHGDFSLADKSFVSLADPALYSFIGLTF